MNNQESIPSGEAYCQRNTLDKFSAQAFTEIYKTLHKRLKKAAYMNIHST